MKKRFKKIDNLFIHIGQNDFYPDQLNRNIIESFPGLNKPGDHCLWGSPVQSKNSWKRYINSECFSKRSKKSFYFSLTGKIKVIKSAKDLMNLPLIFIDNIAYINWAKVAQKYDGVIIMITDDEKAQGKSIFYNSLYLDISFACDVDSVVIFNPKSVHVLNKYDGKQKSKIIRKNKRIKEKKQK